MTKIFEEVSRTFDEYLLIPNLTTRKCTPQSIDLSTALSKIKDKDKRP